MHVHVFFFSRPFSKNPSNATHDCRIHSSKTCVDCSPFPTHCQSRQRTHWLIRRATRRPFHIVTFSWKRLNSPTRSRPHFTKANQALRCRPGHTLKRRAFASMVNTAKLVGSVLFGQRFPIRRVLHEMRAFIGWANRPMLFGWVHGARLLWAHRASARFDFFACRSVWTRIKRDPFRVFFDANCLRA